MWRDIDFSTLHIEFDLDNLHITVLNANRMVFFESFPNHMHSFYELHYIFSGSGTLICNKNVYPLSAGMLYLNGRNVFHEQITDPGNIMMEYSVSFDIQTSGGRKNGFMEKLKNMELWIGNDTNEIGNLFREIEKELETRKQGDIHIIRSLCEMIFVKMMRNFNTENKDTETFGKNLNDRRKFIMDEAFIYDYRDMTLASLAKILNLSERQTIRNIKEYYGMNFTEFRNQSRLSAAAKFLAEDTLTVSEIAEKVGFSSIAYFRKLFRETYGAAPAEYRLKQEHNHG